MDVQKVAAQQSAAQQSGQRKEDGAPKSLSSFVEMIRSPMALMTPGLDPFAAHEQAASTSTRSDVSEPARDRDNQNDKDDYRPEKTAKADNDHDDAAPKRVEEDRDTTSRADDGHRDDDHADKSGSVEDDGANDARSDDGGEDKVAKTDNNDDATAGTDDTDENLPIESDKGQQAAVDPAHRDLAVAPALDNLRNQTQTANGDAIAAAAREVAAAAKTNGVNPADKGPQGPQTPQQGQTGEQNSNASNRAGEALARVGSQAPGPNANQNQAANANQQSLADQQAQALASQLKSDTPTKVNVRVTDRGAANANVNAQTDPQANAQRSETAQTVSTKPATTPQTAQVRVDGAGAAEARADQAAVAQNQAQAQAQLAKGAANAAAESGFARAAARVGSSGSQAVGGVEAGGSAAQASGQTQQQADIHRAAQAQAAKQSTPNRPVAQQISVNITKAIADGLDHINIKLRPAELGRVEVRLEVGNNGKVHAQIIADKPETLDLLRNEARNLEKALQDAGFDTGSGDLSFDLRNQEQNGDGEKSGLATASGDSTDNGDAEIELAHMIMNGEPLSIISEDRVDIQA